MGIGNAITHVEWGRHWSGGTNQVLLLMLGLREKGVQGQLVCATKSAIAQRAADQQIPIFPFPLRGEQDLPTWLRFARFLKHPSSLIPYPSSLLHVHSRRGALPTLLIARWLRLPTVLHWRVAAPLRLPVHHLADAVIAISEATAIQAQRARMPPEQVFLVRSAVDTDAFAPVGNAHLQAKQQWGLGAEAFVVATTGRLAAGKGHDGLLRAVALLSPPERPVVLLAGDGSERTRLQQLAGDLRIAESVRFLGFQKDVRPVLWAADAFVHVPTHFPEGVSVAVLEAMASGLPVIASKVGGIPEVVRDGETGLLVPPGDATVLAEALRHLRTDPSLRRRLGEGAQAYVRRHCSVQVLVERTLQVYATVLGEPFLATLR